MGRLRHKISFFQVERMTKFRWSAWNFESNDSEERISDGRGTHQSRNVPQGLGTLGTLGTLQIDSRQTIFLSFDSFSSPGGIPVPGVMIRGKWKTLPLLRDW